MSDAEVRPCPACGGGDSRPVGEVGGFSMQSCHACGTVFTARLPTAAESKDYARYYHDTNLEVPPFVRRRLDELVSPFDADRRLNRWLDVGCGAGTLMQAVRGRGWDVIGTEVAERAAEAMRAKGFQVRSGELEQLDLPEASFDVVSSMEVVEHVPDVNALLRECRRLLRPGGALYLTTPHGRGISARLLGTDWSVVGPPEHLQLFSIPGLRAALARAGFAVRSVRTGAVNPTELLQAARRRGRATRHRPMRPGARVESGYRLNESLSSSRAGSVVKGVANAALSATRLGDTLKLVAQRPS